MPAALYPTGIRNFLRVYPTDDFGGAALALLARDRGRTRVFVLDDGDPGYGALQATTFETAARRVGLDVVGRASWDPRADEFTELARRVAGSGADAVYVGGLIDTNAGRVLRDLRGRLSADVDLLGPAVSPRPDPHEEVKRCSARHVPEPLGLVPESLPPAAARWSERFMTTQPGADFDPRSVYAAQATEVLLDAIARSDGTRRSVLDELFRMHVVDGLLGSFRFDANGDISESPMTIVQIRRGGSDNRVQSIEGAPVVRVVRPSPSLVAPED